MAPRVLVTGGLGFIGSHLCASLLDEGAEVRIVDDLSGQYADGTGPAAAGMLTARGAEVTIGPAAPAQLNGVDAVIHLAGLPGVRTRRSPSALREANVLLTERLVRAASARGDPLRARVELVGVRRRSRAADSGARDPGPAQPLRREQGGSGGRRARSRRRRGDRPALHGLRAGPAPGDGVRALDRPAGRPAAAALVRAARHRAGLHLRGRRRGRHPRRAAPRPGRRGLQPVRLALGGAAGSARRARGCGGLPRRGFGPCSGPAPRLT